MGRDYQLKLLNENLESKEALKKRPLIERRFGAGKKWHGLGRACYWGKVNVAIQAWLTFLVISVKRMVKPLQTREHEVGLLETGQLGR